MQMKFEIKSRWSGSVLFSVETDSWKLALEAAVKSGAVLRGADLRGAVLRGAVLRGAVLSDADLRGAVLSGAVLSDADLSGAEGLPQAPVIPNIDARILRAIESGGSLDMSHWHICETTHCRAGWACVLAGYAGGILEAKTSPYLAGKLIYEASRPGVAAPNFFASNEAAFEDIRAWAAKDPIKE
jgi:uncharacterized protein YjbI with pentapeptide repeats